MAYWEHAFSLMALLSKRKEKCYMLSIPRCRWYESLNTILPNSPENHVSEKWQAVVMLSGMVFWRNRITRNAQIIVILKIKHNHNVVFYFPGVFNVSQRHLPSPNWSFLTLDLTNINVQNRNILSHFLKSLPQITSFSKRLKNITFITSGT